MRLTFSALSRRNENSVAVNGQNGILQFGEWLENRRHFAGLDVFQLDDVCDVLAYIRQLRARILVECRCFLTGLFAAGTAFTNLSPMLISAMPLSARHALQRLNHLTPGQGSFCAKDNFC